MGINGSSLAMSAGIAAATWAVLTAVCWAAMSLPAAALTSTFLVGVGTALLGRLNRP